MLVLLLLAVVVPTVCVLWFMAEAVRNERLAVRQKLADVYRETLVEAQETLATRREHVLGKAAAVVAEEDPSLAFFRLVEAAVVPSVIIRDRDGSVRYPRRSEPPGEMAAAEGWGAAGRMEYERDNPAAAATAYAELAERTENVDLAAQALQAQARCLVKAGRQAGAVEIVIGRLGQERFARARDRQGRLIVPNARLFALQTMTDPHRDIYKKTLDSLVRRVQDYRDGTMPSNQRRFLMHQLKTFSGVTISRLLLDAEDLAAAYLESDTAVPDDSRVRPTRVANVWQVASADKTIVVLLTRGCLAAPSIGVSLPAHVRIDVVPPDASNDKREPFLTMPAGEGFPGWRLALYLEEADPFSAAADRQVTVYVWTGVLVVAAIAAFAVVAGRYVLRQMRLTRLKNDFVATVTHELKTPLASMRLLVDTLLAGHVRDQKQATEYLELAAKENERLSRLIDNFLTFSRMERNKRTFEFVEVEPGEIVRTAVDAVRERFETGGCRLTVEVADDLPTITADRDAMVTVLLNLLDNAHKYSDNDKRITVRAYSADGNVCLEVVDHGIGLSRRDAKRVFGRFYQVDQSLSRRAGGCGLGLSIVKFIVDAHGGTIDVASRPGEGSTFTIKLPGTE